MQKINVTVNPAPMPETPAPVTMRAGRFYLRKRDGQIVFVASTGPRFRDPELRLTRDGPDYKTPVVAIGGDDNGYSLRGLFGDMEDYEELGDVEIVVSEKPRA